MSIGIGPNNAIPSTKGSACIAVIIHQVFFQSVPGLSCGLRLGLRQQASASARAALAVEIYRAAFHDDLPGLIAGELPNAGLSFSGIRLSRS